MKTLYFDCFSGISGDMTIGALIDAGADPDAMRNELAKLDIQDEYKLTWEKVNKNGITCTKFDVHLQTSEDGGHHHEHGHHHDHHHHHGHHHRHYSDIVDIINDAELNDDVKELSLAMFKIIGEAEGNIHGIPLEKVHFHEVGAVDSIIDIIGTAILIDQIKPDVIKSSAVPTGNGQIHIDHGVYPVPAPATLEILKGVPIKESTMNAELTTPTGAAIIATLVQEFGPVPSMTVEQIGYGAGTKTFPDHPNVLRVMIGNQE